MRSRTTRMVVKTKTKTEFDDCGHICRVVVKDRPTDSYFGYIHPATDVDASTIEATTALGNDVRTTTMHLDERHGRVTWAYYESDFGHEQDVREEMERMIDTIEWL